MASSARYFVKHTEIDELAAVTKAFQSKNHEVLKPLNAHGLESSHATAAMGQLMLMSMQGFEDIGILDEVASELTSSMDEVEVNEEEALFEVGHAAYLACMPAEPQASSPAQSIGWP